MKSKHTQEWRPHESPSLNQSEMLLSTLAIFNFFTPARNSLLKELFKENNYLRFPRRSSKNKFDRDVEHNLIGFPEVSSTRFVSLLDSSDSILWNYCEMEELISLNSEWSQIDVLPRYVPGHQPVPLLVLISDNMAILLLPKNHPVITADNIRI